MDEDRNFLKSLLAYLEDDTESQEQSSTILTGH